VVYGSFDALGSTGRFSIETNLTLNPAIRRWLGSGLFAKEARIGSRCAAHRERREACP